jgi:hypothetical protein
MLSTLNPQSARPTYAKATAGRQRKLVLPGECGLCAMTTIAGARDRLPGHDEDDVLALIEETGDLSWAWNIGLGDAREIRLLTKCVEHFAATGAELDWEFDRVLKAILHGYKKPFIGGTHLQILFNCSSTHVINLIEADVLAVLPGTSWNTGPKGTPLVALESFVGMLKTRRVP